MPSVLESLERALQGENVPGVTVVPEDGTEPEGFFPPPEGRPSEYHVRRVTIRRPGPTGSGMRAVEFVGAVHPAPLAGVPGPCILLDDLEACPLRDHDHEQLTYWFAVREGLSWNASVTPDGQVVTIRDACGLALHPARDFAELP
jgi:hypothetical protein